MVKTSHRVWQEGSLEFVQMLIDSSNFGEPLDACWFFHVLCSGTKCVHDC